MISHQVLGTLSLVLHFSSHIRKSLLSRNSGTVSFHKQSLVLLLKSQDNFIQLSIFLSILVQFHLKLLILCTGAQSNILAIGILGPPNKEFLIFAFEGILQYLYLLQRGFQFFLVPQSLQELGVYLFLVKTISRFGGIPELSSQLFYFVLEHFIFFLQFLLTEELTIMFTFKFLDSFPEFADFQFFLSDGFEMVWLANKDFIGVIDDMPQFNVLCLELSYLQIFLVKFVADIFLQLGCSSFLALIDHGFAGNVQFSLELGYFFLVGDRLVPEFFFQFGNLQAIVLKSIIILVFELVIFVELHSVLRHLRLKPITLWPVFLIYRNCSNASRIPEATSLNRQEHPIKTEQLLPGKVELRGKQIWHQQH